MAAVALTAPGFAGMFWDSVGRLVLKTTPDADASAVRDAVADPDIAGLFHGVQAALAEGRVRFVPDARYDFASLVTWLEALAPSLAKGGVTYWSVDEVRNSIRIGVAREDVAAGIRGAAAEVPVPTDALSFEVGHATQPLTDLRDRFRPIPGGVQVERWAGPNGGCTLGANVDTDIGSGFITASHCTVSFWSLDEYALYQPDNGTPSDFVGWERSDPDPFTGSVACKGYDFCRYSDAAFTLYEGEYADQGYIARTTGLGSITIDFWHPRFTITEAGGWPLVGDEIAKMGRTSGWTSGEVTETCVDIPITQYPGGLYLCQFETDAFADFGDSGGPFFTWPLYGDDVTLQGLVTGRRTYGGQFVSSFYSSWTYIALEIGADVGVLTADR